MRPGFVLGALLAAGCATAISGSADSIARLEQERAADPKSEAVERSLGIAYFKANRFGDARTALQQATAMDARDGVAALYLGLTAEAQNDITGARKAYQSYLEVGRTRAAKNQIRARMEALKLKEVQLAARSALARESELAGVQAPDNTIAVMPFTFTGPDTTLKPLERGFAELVTTDLSRVSRLNVVDRMRLQAVLDEMALQQREGLAGGTGVRLGHILQVREVVAGSILQQGNELTTNAIAVNAATSAATPEARDQQTVENLFTMEKHIVLGLLQNMNIPITTAERNAIDQRPTASLAAFLAFSRGLQLEDQGRFDEASRSFDNAVNIDPGFAGARSKSQEAKSAVTGSLVTASTVESSLRGSSEGAVVSTATSTSTGSVGGGASTVAEGLNPSPAGNATSGAGSTTTQPVKDPSAGTGDNPTTKTAKVTIKIGQPGHP
jgi:TolB-like protein